MPATRRAPVDPTAVAAEVMRLAREGGFHVSTRSGSVVTVHKTFTPGDAKAFCEAEGLANSILGKLPVLRSQSSVWGTDGASIGGAGSLQKGYFTLHKSGVQKRVLAAVSAAALRAAQDG